VSLVRRIQKQDGLTLVEVLIAVAIISLLAVLAVSKAQAALDTARQARLKKDMQTVQAALERHYLEHDFYPQRLKYLIDRGYLRTGFDFRSAVSRSVLFYAVDNNLADGLAKHFALGDPGKKPNHVDYALFRSKPLPNGRNPASVAYAWVEYDDYGLALQKPGDAGGLPEHLYPDSLEGYRTSCQPGATGPCDLISN